MGLCHIISSMQEGEESLTLKSRNMDNIGQSHFRFEDSVVLLAQIHRNLVTGIHQN